MSIIVRIHGGSHGFHTHLHCFEFLNLCFFRLKLLQNLNFENLIFEYFRAVICLAIFFLKVVFFDLLQMQTYLDFNTN